MGSELRSPMVNKVFSDHNSPVHPMYAGAHSTGTEVFTATVTNTGPAVMSKRTGLVALAAAALMMVASTASAGAREVVRYEAEVQPGTIVVKTAERRLYLVLGDGEATRYTVAEGRPGKQWQGKAQVSGRYVQPAWTPPAEVKADNPNLPEVIPGGAPNNPMGVAAMTLSGGEYAIHGTNKPDSIGKFARTAASACSTTTSPTCSSAWTSAPRWWCCAEGGATHG